MGESTPPPAKKVRGVERREALPVFLPYASYSGTRIAFYAGWQPNGFFGFKFNLVSAS